MRFVYKTCGWQKKLTYRVPGEKYAPDSHLVYFDMRQAYEIHQGRMVVVPMRRKMLLRMSEDEMKNGVDAHFFRADKSDCNAFALRKIDTTHHMRL